MEHCDIIIDEVLKAFVGTRQTVKKILMALLAGGHVLLEDIPGVGKTTMAVAFSKALGLSNNRIQFTPDVMPSDIVGYSILRRETGAMEYQPGAAMCNFLLADEINRASARSQSALLEAMQENSVTVDGQTHMLPQPFIVLATQNPTGSAGTQLLPDSQTDRFIMRLSIGYPGPEDELDLLQRKHGEYAESPVGTVSSAEKLLAMREETSKVFIHEAIYQYILSLSRATRENPDIQQGASPRCTLALAALSQASAYIDGRDYVLPKDVADIYLDCCAHRLILAPKAEREKRRAEDILLNILEAVNPPRLRVK